MLPTAATRVALVRASMTRDSLQPMIARFSDPCSLPSTSSAVAEAAAANSCVPIVEIDSALPVCARRTVFESAAQPAGTGASAGMSFALRSSDHSLAGIST